MINRSGTDALMYIYVFFLELVRGGSFVSLGLYLCVSKVRYIHRLLSLWCQWMLCVLVCFIQY